ncbi:hypothetical protein PEY55_22105, partial [Citrobacter portucalensis]|nr:hypothetical protein [Citrobacter portucalensis]
IFPPGAGIVKGAAIAPLTRSLAFSVQRSDEHKVNGTFSRRKHIHYAPPTYVDTGALTVRHCATCRFIYI